MGVASIVWKILVIITAIAIIILTVPYWIHLSYSVGIEDWLWVILDVLSAIFMIILGTIGLIGALKPGRMLLLIYAIGMLCMFVFILIQLIINAGIYQKCEDRIFYVLSCNYNIASYIAPTVIMLVITIVGGIAAIFLRKQLVEEEKPSGSYY